jgi:PAS domain S-box-containing protein
MAALLGFTREEMKGRAVTACCFAEDIPLAHARIGSNLRGNDEQFDFRFQRKDGRELLAMACTSPMRDTQGQIVGALGMFTDATEQKRLEQALRQSEERLRIALKDTVITVYQQDRELRYTWIYNPLPVYTVEDILGKTDADFIQAEEAAHLIALKRRVLDTGQGYQEVIKTTGLAGTRYFDLVIEPLRDQHGAIIGVTGAAVDVTERIEFEERKDHFISMASHELKTPITTLKGLTQLLVRKLERQGMQEPLSALSRMNAQISRLVKLIDELLDVSKIQAGRLDYEEESVDIDALVHETVEVLQPGIPTHILNVSEVTHAVIVGDKDRLGQVLTNLITNAVKYSPGANNVDITLSTSKQTATISVHDYGVGIPQAHLKYIFDRFYRVYDSRNKAFPGLGIGLHIAYEIVKRHGGDITVESEEGKGSTFIVSLPLKKEEPV